MIINNKRIWLGLFIGIVMSFSVYGQNINAEKITVPDSKLTNLYQIDSGVYRSEQPSDADFKALEKYGIREVLNLRNRHSDDDEAAGTKIKLVSALVAATASFAVLKTGFPRCSLPPFPGTTPPTIFVPYAIHKPE